MAKPRARKGCFVSTKVAIVLCVVFILLAVAVGVIVHLAAKASSCDAGSEHFWNLCEQQAHRQEYCITDEPCDPSSSGRDDDDSGGAVSDVYLPDTLDPVHYDLKMRPWIYDPGNPEGFVNHGEAVLHLRCVKATDVITVHSNGLRVDEESVVLSADGSDRAPRVKAFSSDTHLQFFSIHLDSQLHAGTTYRLSMRWEADIDDSLTGLYRSSYTEDGQTKWLATTQLQATDARKTFPCLDEPAFKTTFNVTLTRRTDYMTLANAPLLQTTEEFMIDGTTYVSDVYERSAKMPTYLVAFLFAQFEAITRTTPSGLPIKLWVRPEALSQAQYALDIGYNMLLHYEEYFNLPYPLPKLDMVGIPDFASRGMENWGLINFRETVVLYEQGVSSAHDKRLIAELMSHELAHMWFGDIVTMHWWDDLWLNEGFASYVEYIGIDHVEPDWTIKDQFLTVDLHPVMLTDALSSSHPIYVPVQDPIQINEIFDSISYSKGASVIRMMSSFMGEESFKRGITRYLNKYRYESATHGDLWNSLNEQAVEDNLQLDIETIMNTWILQMGYPVVKLYRDGADRSTLHAEQSYFLLNTEATWSTKYPSPYQYTWSIPLTYVTSTSPESSWSNPDITWMLQENVTIQGADTGAQDSWVLGNVGQQGYYRVNYDDDNWLQLGRQLQQDSTAISTANRAQILDDAFNLARAGMIDQTIALNISRFMHEEESYVVWEAYLRNMDYIRAMLQSSRVYGKLQTYVQQQMPDIYRSFGWDITVYSHIDRYMQALVLEYACVYQVGDCNQRAIEAYTEWKEDPSNIVPELKKVIWCEGIRQGGSVEWDYLLQKYKESSLAAEQETMVRALACAQQPWILNRYLHLMEEGETFRKTDFLRSMTEISHTAVGHTVIWDYVRSDWTEKHKKFGGGIFMMGIMIDALTEQFSTEGALRELEDFIQETDDLEDADRAFHQALEKTRGNVRWRNQNEAKVEAWLDHNAHLE